MSLPALPELAAWFLAGIALGTVYLLLLSRSVAAFEPPASYRSAVAWLLLRLAVAAGVLVLAALQGAVQLLAVLAGFLVARMVAIRRFGRE